MKLIISLFSIFIFAQQCNDTNNKKASDTNAQDAIEIIYEASTRGFYEKITLSKKQLSLTKIRGGKVSIQQDMNADDWKEILKLLDNIDSEKLKKNYINVDDLKRDAVIPATLVINYKENTVTNVTLGHGNAPEILQPLMTKIDAMANAVDKP